MNELAVSARGLNRVFESGSSAVHAVCDLDLDVQCGEFVAIMGPSGCGKSTLLYLLAGLDIPTTGEVRISGKRIDDLGEGARARQRRKNVGFVFQFFNLLPSLTVAENVDLPLRLAGKRERTARRQSVALLQQLGLGERLDFSPSLLSGGEQQRVAIARALANEPRIVFADEPTGNLDSASARDVLSVLKSANAQGQSMLVATHDTRVAAAADRVITMRDGAITSDRRLEHGAATRAYLEASIGEL